MTFNGNWIELPWEDWRGIMICPTAIITRSERTIEPNRLDLMLWKAAFYDRGKQAQDQWAEPPEWLTG